MTALLDHLWQSSLFALAAGLLSLALSGNAARIRFWLWFTASLKFLLPFAALVFLGERLARLMPAPLLPSLRVLAPAAEKFSAPAQVLAPAHGAVETYHRITVAFPLEIVQAAPELRHDDLDEETARTLEAYYALADRELLDLDGLPDLAFGV